MRMNGTLEQYLTDLNRDAQDMFELLIKQYAASEGVTEKLKEADQMAWIGKMKNIHARVTEVVNRELIYN